LTYWLLLGDQDQGGYALWRDGQVPAPTTATDTY